MPNYTPIPSPHANAAFASSQQFKLWLRWLALNLSSWLLGWALAWLLHHTIQQQQWLESALDNVPFLNRLRLSLEWCLICATVSIGQWWVLRTRLPRLPWQLWCLATTAGGGISATLIPPGKWLLFFSACCGFSVGMAQWWVLRQHLRPAGYWAAATTITGVLTFPLILLSFRVLPFDFDRLDLAMLVIGLFVQALGSGLTGLVLVRGRQRRWVSQPKPWLG